MRSKQLLVEEELFCFSDGFAAFETESTSAAIRIKSKQAVVSTRLFAPMDTFKLRADANRHLPDAVVTDVLRGEVADVLGVPAECLELVFRLGVWFVRGTVVVVEVGLVLDEPRRA